MVGWELPAPVDLAQGTRLGNLDLTVYNMMNGSGPWMPPSGTWGWLLCASASLLAFLLLLRRSGILLYVGSSGSRSFLHGLLLLASQFFLLLGVGLLKYPPGSWCVR